MPRLSREDRAAAREIEGLLSTVVDGAPPILETVMPALRRYLGTERTLCYGVGLEADGCALSFAHGAGWGQLRPGLAEELRPWIRASEGHFGLYDAARVEAAQRNRALTLPRLGSVLEETAVRPRSTARSLDNAEATGRIFRALDIHDRTQLRVLLCDGPRLLAWVGGFQTETYDARQVQRLGALRPALGRRLRLEERLAGAALYAAALPAVLERVAGAAFLVAATGEVHLANTAGRARYDHDPRGTTATLREAIRRPGAAALEVTPLRVEGAPPCYLVVDRPPAKAPGPRVHAAARRYGLTPREAEVLLHLVQGGSNRAIALSLGCAERTVEVHVAHLLDKVGVPSRAALVARFWMDG